MKLEKAPLKWMMKFTCFVLCTPTQVESWLVMLRLHKQYWDPLSTIAVPMVIMRWGGPQWPSPSTTAASCKSGPPKWVLHQDFGLLEPSPGQRWRGTSSTRGLYSLFDREKPPYRKLLFLAVFIENCAPFIENSILTIFTDPKAKKSENVVNNQM